ncbi:MAG: hypothetical protein DRQ44_02305 [Gammaproteobacteria bacterium]|nr:MAG: hypothetical protein DRQ44_02305 [Gammaproteobacteria bacterium]
MTEYTAEIDEALFEVLTVFSQAAESVGTSWLLVGATARILLLENIYGLPQGRATQDVDFGVQVGDWAQYKALCDRLKEQGVYAAERKPEKRFRTKQDMVFDLVPYGGVEDGNGRVFWPPDNDDVMTVRGFGSAGQAAIEVVVNKQLTVPVISPCGLCELKLFAWEERHKQQPGKDAQDIAYIIRHIEALYPAEKLFNDYMPAVEVADYNIPLAGVFQLGKGIANMLKDEENKFLSTFVANELAQQDDSVLCRELHNYMNTSSIDETIEALVFLHKGLCS